MRKKKAKLVSLLLVLGAGQTPTTVATAAHDVLLDQFGQLAAAPYGFASPQSFIKAEYTASPAQIPYGPAKASGITQRGRPGCGHASGRPRLEYAALV